jgi:hypothetical protein
MNTSIKTAVSLSSVSLSSVSLSSANDYEGIKFTSVEQAAEQIKELLAQGIKSFYKAGRIYAAAVSEDVNNDVRIRELIPGFSPGFWKRLDNIGRGGLIPEAMIAGGKFIGKIEVLPVSEQRKCVSEPIEVYITDASGKGDVLRVPLQSMTPEQAQRVFAKDHIRPPAEQRNIIESEKTQKATLKKSTNGLGWQVKKGVLIVPEPRSFSLSEIEGIVKEMKACK